MTFQFLGLRRPQYPSSPEVLLSALAWATVSRTDLTKHEGLIYVREDSSVRRPGSVQIAETRPPSAQLAMFASSLAGAGLQDLRGTVTPEVANAVANSMIGVRPRRGKGTPSSAIGIAGALLQDPVGGLATESPPAFAHLINSIYALGGSRPAVSAAQRWFEAASHAANDSGLRRIERAFVETTLAPYIKHTGIWPPTTPIPNGPEPDPFPEWWIKGVVEAGIATPFSWFRTSWDRLCSPEWYEMLPARRWASWAICLLRHALGFTFLWEANFFRELVRGVLGEESGETVTRLALAPSSPLIQQVRGSVSEMDVMPRMKRLLTIGLACRNALGVIVEESRAEHDLSLASLVRHLRKSLAEEQRESLRAALTGKGDLGGLKNLIETVRYSLAARADEGGGESDHYGLLRTVNRNYTHVAPGAEWIVVLSAIAVPDRNSVIRLGDVLQSITALGFQPRIDFFLAELERAGLCVSAPDGDEGIEINLGFGGA